MMLIAYKIFRRRQKTSAILESFLSSWPGGSTRVHSVYHWTVSQALLSVLWCALQLPAPHLLLCNLTFISCSFSPFLLNTGHVSDIPVSFTSRPSLSMCSQTFLHWQLFWGKWQLGSLWPDTSPSLSSRVELVKRISNSLLSPGLEEDLGFGLGRCGPERATS